MNNLKCILDKKVSYSFVYKLPKKFMKGLDGDGNDAAEYENENDTDSVSDEPLEEFEQEEDDDMEMRLKASEDRDKYYVPPPVNPRAPKNPPCLAVKTTINWTYGLEKYYKRTRKKRTNFTSEYDPPESRVVETGNEYIDHYDESERVVIKLMRLEGYMRFPKNWLEYATSSNAKQPSD